MCERLLSVCGLFKWWGIYNITRSVNLSHMLLHFSLKPLISIIKIWRHSIIILLVELYINCDKPIVSQSSVYFCNSHPYLFNATPILCDEETSTFKMGCKAAFKVLLFRKGHFLQIQRSYQDYSNFVSLPHPGGLKKPKHLYACHFSLLKL